MTTESRAPVSFIQGSEQINPALQAALLAEGQAPIRDPAGHDSGRFHGSFDDD